MATRVKQKTQQKNGNHHLLLLVMKYSIIMDLRIHVLSIHTHTFDKTKSYVKCALLKHFIYTFTT